MPPRKVGCRGLAPEDAGRSAVVGANSDQGERQPHSEAECYKVYYCLGIKLHSPVSALLVGNLLILFPPAFLSVYLQTFLDKRELIH